MEAFIAPQSCNYTPNSALLSLYFMIWNACLYCYNFLSPPTPTIYSHHMEHRFIWKLETEREQVLDASAIQRSSVRRFQEFQPTNLLNIDYAEWWKNIQWKLCFTYKRTFNSVAVVAVKIKICHLNSCQKRQCDYVRILGNYLDDYYGPGVHSVQVSMGLNVVLVMHASHS